MWVLSADNALDIRTVSIIWGSQEEVFISEGLQSGEQIVSSDLATPVQGMLLRTAVMGKDQPAQGSGKKQL